MRSLNQDQEWLNQMLPEWNKLTIDIKQVLSEGTGECRAAKMLLKDMALEETNDVCKEGNLIGNPDLFKIQFKK